MSLCACFRSMILKKPYNLCPSPPFNQELYISYWPVSGEDEPNAIFKQHCSGIKLAPTSIFTHLKAKMLKRRSKVIMQHGTRAAEEWLAAQDRPPTAIETRFFADHLSEYGDLRKIDSLLDSNIFDYSFRPFLNVKAFILEELLKKFEKRQIYQGGIIKGGTRRRPEIIAAYSSEDTIGFALSHSPKDQKEILKQFASFCWYYPDNDLCRRGDSFIYLNQYPKKGTRNRQIVNNINDRLCNRLSMLLGDDICFITKDVVFYTFAVLCSQVFLDEFNGALYIAHRADMRPRIPIVDNADIFRKLTSLGRRIAELEKREYVPANHMKFDFAAIQAQIPPDFRLKRIEQPFDEQHETLTLTDGTTLIEVPCPLDVQRINIAGYDVIKNIWLKFNSYDYTHCIFTHEDVTELLNLINKLIEYIDLVGEIDVIMYEIIEGKYPLIQPIEGTVNE